MPTPKTDEAKDIQTVNRLVSSLTPILCFDKEMTPFIKERVFRQLAEIKDRGLSYAAHFFYYFTTGQIDKGFEFAEKAIEIMPTDLITWRHYTLCVFWRCGSLRTIDIVKRAMAATHSPTLAFEGCFYAANVADFDFFLEMYDFLLRTGKFDELLSDRKSEDEERSMHTGIDNANLVKRYGKTEELRAVAALMYEKLPLGKQHGLANLLVDVSDEDEQALLYELHFDEVDAEKCAAMNVELISERIEAGLTDWSVSGVYVAKSKELKGNASHA
ncbi:hypothetical protein [Yersinia intermedia]|uniref:hypothetical protein n=1 Tax=Yersinia intermedia TaxID=631 RepID=UPI0011A0E5B8|nr:hypothetical protein [Yersinia intermedia]